MYICEMLQRPLADPSCGSSYDLQTAGNLAFSLLAHQLELSLSDRAKKLQTCQEPAEEMPERTGKLLK